EGRVAPSGPQWQFAWNRRARAKSRSETGHADKDRRLPVCNTLVQPHPMWDDVRERARWLRGAPAIEHRSWTGTTAPASRCTAPRRHRPEVAAAAEPAKSDRDWHRGRGDEMAGPAGGNTYTPRGT